MATEKANADPESPGHCAAAGGGDRLGSTTLQVLLLKPLR
jgi:hypothetical protein